MPKKCPDCKLEYPTDAERCITCGRPAPSKGFPNVLLAEKPNEKKELKRLYDDAIADSTRAGAITKLREFERRVQSEARLITACRFKKFFDIGDQEGGIFPTFQQLYHAELAFAGDDPNNNVRLIAEEATLPGCSRRTHYAVMAIDEVGLMHYGNYSLIWKLDMVAHRTSLFIANCLTWRQENGMALGSAAPVGNRARWKDRHVLAVIKCASQITSRTKPSSFPRMLVRNRSKKDPYDVFIEGHIWGPLTRMSLLKVICTSPETSPAKQMMAEEIADELRKSGIDVEGL
jgi:hypothetical protein